MLGLPHSSGQVSSLLKMPPTVQCAGQTQDFQASQKRLRLTAGVQVTAIDHHGALVNLEQQYLHKCTRQACHRDHRYSMQKDQSPRASQRT